MYLGDFNQNQTVNSQFTSVNANGTPTTLANGSLAVYKNNNTTERTANLTLSADFDGRTGLNNVNIDMSLNTSFYASGNDFTCVLAAGDIAGVTVLGNSTLFSWSVNNRAGSLSSDATLMLGINSNVSQTLTHAANANTTSAAANTTITAANTTINTANTHASNANTSATNANTTLNANRAEPGQGAPAASVSLASKVDYLYKGWRNKKDQSNTTFKLYADDASTVDQKATVSDDGTTTTIGEIATGP